MVDKPQKTALVTDVEIPRESNIKENGHEELKKRGGPQRGSRNDAEGFKEKADSKSSFANLCSEEHIPRKS